MYSDFEKELGVNFRDALRKTLNPIEDANKSDAWVKAIKILRKWCDEEENSYGKQI